MWKDIAKGNYTTYYMLAYMYVYTSACIFLQNYGLAYYYEF